MGACTVETLRLIMTVTGTVAYLTTCGAGGGAFASLAAMGIGQFFWHLKHRSGFGMKTVIGTLMKPISMYLGIVGRLNVTMKDFRP